MSILLSDYSLFFCEDAATGTDGKLNVQGIYNELYAPGFPARQDKVVLAGILEWQRQVNGDQLFEMNLLDPEDKAIFTIEGSTQVDARSVDRPPAKTVLVFPLENLVFIQAGQYRVRFTVGADELRGPSLHVLNSGIGE